MDNYFIPNLDSQFKNDLIEFVHNHNPIESFKLEEGCCHFGYPDIFWMLRAIEGNGNNYALLCGASCYNDILSIEHLKEMLKELNIILVYDYVIPNDRAYLIPLKSYKSIEMSEKFVLFTRE